MLERPRRPFTAIFACLLTAVILRPLLANSQIGHVAFAAVMVLFFVAAIRILCRNWADRAAALVLGLTWFATRLPELFLRTPSMPIQVVGHVAEIAFLSLIVTLLVAAILHKHTVTLDNILGAFAGYLLIALIWGIAYSLIEMASPGSFRVHDALESEFKSPARRDWVLNYFSCCTLMTVGYGDVTPVHAAARTLAVLEAMTGQLYLAVLVAVLVGIRVSQGFIRHPEGHDRAK
jgi:hypothetical protein